MDVTLTLTAMLVCLILEGFFSGSEIGVISADQMKLRHAAANGSKGAKLALKMLRNPEWLLSTTLVGTNIAVVTNTTLATALMIHLSPEYGQVLAVLLVAPLIWIFGEIVPKSVFQQRADVITPRIIFLLRLASYLFFPLLIVFTFLTRVITRLVGGEGRNPFTLREEIITMLRMPAQRGGDLDEAETAMIRRMFNFSETTAREIMVPLIDVVAVDRKATCREVIKLAVDRAHVRLPVFDDRIDRMVGIVYALDLMGVDGDQPIEEYVRPARYVPGSKSIKDLLLVLRQAGEMVAVVVDEFGGAEGIVALEDIMEEVVEEMEDEYDTEGQTEQWIRKIGEREYVVNARVELNHLEEKLGFALPEGNYLTLAGFLLDQTREVPQVGTVIESNALVFTITRGTPQAIHEVRVRC
jgi:CBS domain containing-hemolysin-like protein